jgi:hypothetical protein
VPEYASGVPKDWAPFAILAVTVNVTLLSPSKLAVPTPWSNLEMEPLAVTWRPFNVNS